MAKVTVNRIGLIEELTKCGKAVGNQGISQCILIELKGEYLTLSTTDLINLVHVFTLVENGEKDISVCVLYSIFNEAVRKFRSKDIILDLNDSKNEIRLNDEFTITGSDKYQVDDFPVIPVIEDLPYVFDGKEFTDTVKRSALAMSSGEGKINLEGLYISIDESGQVSMSSANGKLGTLDTSLTTENPSGLRIEWFLPKSAVDMIDFEGRIEIGNDDRDRMAILSGSRMQIIRMSENKYPFKAVVGLFDKPTTIVATVNSSSFMEKVSLANISTKRISGGDGKELREYARVSISFTSEGMAITPHDKASHMKFNTMIPCESVGEAKFVINTIDIPTITWLCKKERLTIGYRGEGREIIVTSDDFPNYKTLIMPISSQ